MEIKLFRFFFLGHIEGSGSVQIKTVLDPEGPKSYGSGSVSLV